MDFDCKQGHRSGYKRQSDKGFAWLQFAPDLEARFRASHQREFLSRTRVALLLGVLFFSLSFLLDAYFVPRSAWLWTGIPRLVIMLVALACLAVSYRCADWRRLQHWMLATALVAGAALIPIATVAAQSGVTEYFACFTLVAIFLCFMSGLLFYQATLCVLVIDAAMLASGWLAGLPEDIFLYQGIALVIANCIGLYGCYTRALHARANFLRIGQLNELAERDALTGVYRRGHFVPAATRVWAQAARERKLLAVLMVDVDSFKGYNDHHGHPAGDRCLAEIAAILAEHSRRPLDVVARYGGEEFVVLWYDVTYAKTKVAAEALRAQMAALELEQPGSGSCARVTISTGAAVMQPAAGQNPDWNRLIEMADQALYEAKHRGRNRCVLRRLPDDDKLRAVG